MSKSRKNRAINELFIGRELLNIDGNAVKHPAGILYYANVNPNKSGEKPIDLVGIDIETDAETGVMKLLGMFKWDGESKDYQGNYISYTENMFEHLLSWVKSACDKRFNFAHWNRLDPFQMLRLFLVHFDEDKQADLIEQALGRFGKEGGEFNRKTGEWDLPPIVRVSNGIMEFGIKNAIRSSIQFYYRMIGNDKIKTCWAYDIAGFHNLGLEREADKTKFPKTGRFDWYNKVGKEYHVVDWNRFKVDEDFRKNVLLSNKLDARGAMALGYVLQNDFKNAFKVYPRSLVSSGSLARTAITATQENILTEQGLEGDDLKSQLFDDISSIGIKRYLDEWIKEYGQEVVKDLYSMATESYSGGYIDAIRYGFTASGWYADIASAYPATIQQLYDLRGATIIEGSGEPPVPDKGYIFIRGTVNIPYNVNFHSITIRNPNNSTSNIRPVGEFIASYSWDEREFAKEVGAKFKDEKWYYIKTTGKLSPLAKVTKSFIDLRKRFKAEGNTAEHMAKLAVNSEYGILFECVDIHEMVDGQITKMGFRAGEFWNPIYASIITARARITMAKASTEIEKNGGKPIVLMTDSVTWAGTKEMLPRELKVPWGLTGIKTEKTLGWFEEPEEVKDIVCLGSGRYGFRQFDKKKQKWFIDSKRRGLNIQDLYDEKGVVVDMEFSWHEVLEQMKRQNKTEIDVAVRTLISPSMARIRHEYGVSDLGRIIDDKRTIQAIVGKTKRIFDDKWEDPHILSTTLVETSPYILERGIFGADKLPDGTYPNLRGYMMKQNMRMRIDRKREVDRKRYKRYHKEHKEEMNEDAVNKYQYADSLGYDLETKKKLSRWSWEKIYHYIETGGKEV